MTAPATTSALVVGVRFFKVGKLYHFNAGAFPSIRKGDRVIVETKRGSQMGEVVKFVEGVSPSEMGIKSIERIATPRDLIMAQEWQSKELAAMITCRARAAELRLRGVKIAKAEYNYDGSRLTFLYSTEADDSGRNEVKVDLKSLPSDMAAEFSATQVEFHQIGPRDLAKLLGGPGACGIEERCCSTFLTEFSPVSIKMAKEQGISLNPEEITGMCGRLRCCLVYEYEQYVEARKTLPKIKKRVGTPRGEGKVIDLNPLKQTVIVLTEDGRFEFSKEEIVPLEEMQALAKKAAQPCSRHEGGGCDCGKGKPRGLGGEQPQRDNQPAREPDSRRDPDSRREGEPRRDNQPPRQNRDRGERRDNRDRRPNRDQSPGRDPNQNRN